VALRSKRLFGFAPQLPDFQSTASRGVAFSLQERTLVSVVRFIFNTATMTRPLCVAVLSACLTTHILAQSPTPAASPAQTPADYDLRWDVKIPMRDNVELNATLYLPKTWFIPEDAGDLYAHALHF
jgi:hypothetical protein